MIDFMSPSNRQRLIGAGLYDTAQAVIKEKALELTEAVYEKFLKDTTGRWLGMVEGHHFYEGDGETSDMILCNKLKARFLGTSAFVHIPRASYTVYVHHGRGGGQLPGTVLNKLYHQSAGLPGADLYLMGHSTKLVSARISRPFPKWVPKKFALSHYDLHIVNCGGFSKSNIVGHTIGGIPRGDYAEQGMMTPSPLSAPICTVDIHEKFDRARVAI